MNVAFPPIVSVDNVREICPLASLVQVIIENVKLAINFKWHLDTIQSDTGFRFDRRLVSIVLWHACWAVIAFFLHIFVGRYLSRSRNGDGSPFPFANVGDDVLADFSSSPDERGRRFATAKSGGVISRSSPLAYQVSVRNSLSTNGSDALATNSHSSPTSQTISNLTPPTSLTPGDSASTPHPNIHTSNPRSRRTYLSGPVRSKSHRRAHQNVILNIFEPRPAKTTPLLVTLLAWTTLPTPPPNGSSVFEPRPADSTRHTPLFATLHPGLGGLTEAPQTQWFIFVIAVTCEKHGVIDPEFDLAFLQKVFGQSKSKNVRLEWLAEGDATLENIQAKLISLYREAQENFGPFRLCIYLTGIGDGNSKMCLFGSEVVSEEELGSWTLGLHDQSTSNQNSNSIGAIFDCCRETMKQRDSMDHRLGLVWSSSVGEPPSANAYFLGNGLPMSCFLIALFSVANDAIITGSSAFGEAIRLRLEQIGEFLRFCYDRQHETNEKYEDNKVQKYPLLAPQVPEWDAAGLDMLRALAELIKAEYSEYALEVSQALAREMEEQGFPTRSVGLKLMLGNFQVNDSQRSRTIAICPLARTKHIPFGKLDLRRHTFVVRISEPSKRPGTWVDFVDYQILVYFSGSHQ